MTFKTYQIVSIVLFVSLVITFFFYENFGAISWFNTKSFLIAVNFCFPVLLSLSVLYINIYALLMKIEPATQFGRPVTTLCLIGSIIFLTAALTPSVVGYSTILDLETFIQSEAGWNFEEITNDAQSNETIKKYNTRNNKNFYNSQDLFAEHLMATKDLIEILFVSIIAYVSLFIIFIVYIMKKIKSDN